MHRNVQRNGNETKTAILLPENLSFILGEECGLGKLRKRLLGTPSFVEPLWWPIRGEPIEKELSKPLAADPGLGVG